MTKNVEDAPENFNADESLGRLILGLGLELDRLLENGRQTVRVDGQIAKIEVDYAAAASLAVRIRTLGVNFIAIEIGRPDLMSGV